VQASRSDRATIENYLKIVDSDETPAALDDLKPLTVTLRNAKASRVEQLLRSVFRSQLAAKNSAAGGSLISTELVVDEATNSLIITAPSALAEHLAAFARSLDESAADNTTREVTIIPLKKTNAARMQKILDMFLDESPAGRAKTTHRP
jgi:type II secretory pathway component GspD/PulD (secretin)